MTKTEAIRQHHYDGSIEGRGYCIKCNSSYPCEVIRLADSYDELLVVAKEVQGWVNPNSVVGRRLSKAIDERKQ